MGNEPLIEDSSSFDRWHSVDEISKHLGVKRDTIYKWIDRKGLPAHKIGKFWKFRKDQIDSWVLAESKEHQVNRSKKC